MKQKSLHNISWSLERRSTIGYCFIADNNVQGKPMTEPGIPNDLS